MQLERWISPRNLLLIAIALFLVTRIAMLNAFPIFNDEAIYLQYSQFIHRNWSGNKFISMNYVYNDWKPPLQYWITAPFIDLGNDPLIVGRTIALLVSFAGLFGFYFFTRELFGNREAAVVALLYALCPTVLFQNDEFVAETFVFSTAALLYWALLAAMRGKRGRWLWLLLATVLAAALVLFKQSGSLLLYAAILLPFTQQRTPRLRAIAIVVLVILASNLIAAAVLPASFDVTKARFNGNWLMSWRELLNFPFKIWANNLHVVAEYITAYYSWLVPFFGAVFLWLAFRRRNLQELTLAAMCTTSGAIICLVLRGFNEYIFNTAIIVTLLPILARTFVVLSEQHRVLSRALLLSAAAVLIVFWSYQIVLMEFSPARYIQRSTTWAVANYLKGWPTGFGIKEVVTLLKKEKGPAVIFADEQWGNPRTALEVYNRKRFPNIAIFPALRDVLGPADFAKFIDMARAQYPVRFAIYSDQSADRPRFWRQPLEETICRERREIKAVAEQTPIIVCEF